MSIQEEMDDFIQDIAEEFELDEEDVRKFCFQNYDVELNSNLNKNAIRYKIEHGEFNI